MRIATFATAVLSDLGTMSAHPTESIQPCDSRPSVDGNDPVAVTVGYESKQIGLWSHTFRNLMKLSIPSDGAWRRLHFKSGATNTARHSSSNFKK